MERTIDLLIGILVLFSLTLKVKGSAFVDIGNLPATVSVFEDVTTSTFLHSVTAFPTSATCTIASGNTGTNFQIDSSGGIHKISTISMPSFDHANQDTYTLVIECSDAPSTSSGTLTVSLINNVAPTFTNIPGGVTISAKTTKANHVIYTVSYTDPDTRPPLTYTNVVTTPAMGPFSLASDQLKVTSDLLTSTVALYTVSFSASDEKNTATGTVTITITDINFAPEFITPIDVTLSLPEDNSGRLKIHDIDHVDANGDAVEYFYSTTEANNAIFDLVGATGEIFLIHGHSFDFENISFYTFKVKIMDYLATGTATYTLTLSVTNVNERPTFTGTPNNVTLAEGAAGTTVGTLSTSCTDPDGDTLTYDIVFDTYSIYFTIADSSTPTVSLAQTWDFDSSLPAVLNLTVRCSDPGGFIDEVIYTVEFTDVNDNDPICTPSQTNFNLLYNQTVNETLLNITCTDADSAYNANLTFTPVGLSSGYTVTFFNVDVNGTVFIKTSFTMDFNTTFYVTILVEDRGTPARSDTITLTVTFTMEPTIIIHKEITRCFFCTTASISIVSAAGFVVFILLSILIYLLILKCCFDYERRKIIRNLQKKKEEKWRWFGCLRPGHRNKPKKSKDEIRRAEKRDKEYMRARNALKGNNDHDYLLARNAMLGPEEESNSLVSPGGHTIPTRFPQKPNPPASQLDKKRRKSGTRRSSAVSIISGQPSVSFIGREKAPSNMSETSKLEKSESKLTKSQREQLDKFHEMRNEKEQRKKEMTESSSLSMKGQAANAMTWSFQGR